MSGVQALLDALSYVGETIDKPGRALRGLFAGRPEELANLIPFSDTMGLTDPSKSVSGRGLLESWGALGENTEGLDAGDVAGFGLEMALDPLNLIPGVAGSKYLKSMRKADAANEAATAFRVANNLPEKYVRQFPKETVADAWHSVNRPQFDPARHMADTTVTDVAPHLERDSARRASHEIANDIKQYGKKLGVDSQILSDPWSPRLVGSISMDNIRDPWEIPIQSISSPIPGVKIDTGDWPSTLEIFTPRAPSYDARRMGFADKSIMADKSLESAAASELQSAKDYFDGLTGDAHGHFVAQNNSPYDLFARIPPFADNPSMAPLLASLVAPTAARMHGDY